MRNEIMLLIELNYVSRYIIFKHNLELVISKQSRQKKNVEQTKPFATWKEKTKSIWFATWKTE
jgi:hypothetical protein